MTQSWCVTTTTENGWYNLMTRDSKPGFSGKRRENGQKAAIRGMEDTYPPSSHVCLLVAQSCLTLCDLMDYSPSDSSVYGILQSKNTGRGCQPLLQGIFLTQGLNPGLPHCRQIPYHLSHQGSHSAVRGLWEKSHHVRGVEKESSRESQASEQEGERNAQIRDWWQRRVCWCCILNPRRHSGSIQNCRKVGRGQNREMQDVLL